jgi:hypothetical protein
METINSTAKAEAVSVETEKHKYDQANWTNLLENMTDMLVEMVPLQILYTDYNFQNSDDNRHFSGDFYGRRLQNEERDNRNWIVLALLQKIRCHGLISCKRQHKTSRKGK